MARKRLFKIMIKRMNLSNHGFFVTKMIILFLNGFDEDMQHKDIGA